MKLATIKDVAEAARCSTTLVSRVMNATRKEDGTPDCVVNPKTAERIFEAVRTLGYRPNKAAVSLRKRLQKRIGVVLPDLSNQFFAGIVKNIEILARENGYVTLFGSSNDDPQQLSRACETFLEDGVDGIIIIPGVNCENTVSKIVKNGIPVVITVRDIPSLTNVGKVLLDSRTSTDVILNHLIDNGYKKIDMLSIGLRLSNVQEKESLYMEYMKSKGLPSKIHHTTDSDADLKILLEQVARSGTDALYCISASLPIRCITAGRTIGIKFPDDIAITGYDGGILYEALNPRLTQVKFSREEIAEEVFKMLMQMVAEKDVIPPTKYLSGEFIRGESSSRPRTHEKNASKGKKQIQEAIASLQKALTELS